MSGFILWSFEAMQQVFKDLERFNRSKIGSKDRNLPSRQPKSAHIFYSYQKIGNFKALKSLLHQSACIHTIRTVNLCRFFYLFERSVIDHYFGAKSRILKLKTPDNHSFFIRFSKFFQICDQKNMNFETNRW